MTTARRIFLHIGLPKTGSSALQALFRRNRKPLAPYVHSILRPDPQTLPLRSACLAYHRAAFQGNELDARRESVRSALAELIADLPPGETPVLLSDENFCGLMPGATADVRLFPVLPELATIFAEAFEGWDLRFVICTRAYAPWLRSTHNQAVRTDRCIHRWDAFEARAVSEGDLTTVVQDLAASVGPEAVLHLPLEEDSKGPHGPGSGLLAALEVPEKVQRRLRIPPRRNESFRPNALEFMRLLNETELDRDQRAIVRKLIAVHPELFDPKDS